MTALIYIVFGFILMLQASAATKHCTKEGDIQYYIYNANYTLQAYHCVVKLGDINECKQLGLDSVGSSKENITAACYQKLHKLQFPQEEISQLLIIPCTSTAQVKLLEETIEFTPTKTCKYSAGYCQLDYSEWPYLLSVAFWTARGRCNDLELIFQDKVEIWVPEGNNVKKYIMTNIFNDSSRVIAMELTEEYRLCGIDFWRTNINGILASTEYLNGTTNNGNRLYQYQDQFKTVHDTRESYCQTHEENEKKNVENSTLELATYTPLMINSRDDITKMENQLYYLTVVIVICVLCIIMSSIFNIYVNFLSLRRAGERQEKRNRLYVLNCICQSLTNRYLYLSKTPDIEMNKLEKPSEDSTTVNNQQPYEYDYVDIHSFGVEKL